MKRFPEANLRLALLLASLVVIVLAGYLVRQKVGEDSADALRWVSHTHEVRATMYELRAVVNQMHATAFGAKLTFFHEYSDPHRFNFVLGLEGATPAQRRTGAYFETEKWLPIPPQASN